MRKIILMTMLALAILCGTANAQYSRYYYHRVGDTIEQDSPIYFHSWWEWDFHRTTGKLIGLNYSGYHSSPLVDSSYFHLQRHFTTDTLKIIGIAGVRPINPPWPGFHITDSTGWHFEPADSTNFTASLYIYGTSPHVCLARVDRQWWREPYRIIHLVSKGIISDLEHDNDYVRPEEWRTTWCCHDHELNTYLGVYEYYFDSAIYVVDSFYVGRSRSSDHYSVNLIAKNLATYDCKGQDCGYGLPTMLDYYKDGLRTRWIESYNALLIFPIIAVDTTVPPEGMCLPLENLRLTSVDTFSAGIAWDDVSTITSAVQVRYGPVATPHANWRTLRVPADSNHITLDLPRREFTDYAVCIRPLCDTAKTVAAWSDTLFFSLPRNTDTTGIPAANAPILSLHPNPTTGEIIVNLPESALGTDLELLDLEGRTLLKVKIQQTETTLNLASFPTGTYFLHAAGTMHRVVKQ